MKNNYSQTVCIIALREQENYIKNMRCYDSKHEL